MADETEPIKLAAITHIPRWMLIITTVNLLLWWTILPIAYGLRQGRMEWFQFAVIGLLIVPVQLMLLFIARLVYYFITQFYWYFVGFLSLMGILFGGTALIASFSRSAPAPFGFDPAIALRLVPADLQTLAGVALIMIAVIAVFMLGRLTVRKPRNLKPETIKPVPSAPNLLTQIGVEEQIIRAQLRQRANDAARLQKR